MAKVVKRSKEFVPSEPYNKRSRYSDYLEVNRQYFGDHPSTLAEKYQKKPKKPKKLAKWIINLMVIASLVIAVITISVVSSVFIEGGGSGPIDINKELSNPHAFVGLAAAPEGKQKLDVSAYKDDSKKLAAYLYNVCAANAKDAPNLTAYNDGWLCMIMGGSANLIDIDSVIMKTQQEYFSIVYHLKNSVPILDSFIGAAIAKTTDVVTTERMYAKNTSKNLSYQKVKNNEYDANGIPVANWESIVDIITQQKPMPVFNSDQNGIFEITKHIMTAETITQAEVKHNLIGGYYTINVTYDNTNPQMYVNSIADIRAGTGDKNALYTQVTTEFTVWDSGYFRSFFLNEKWAAQMLVSLNFELQSNWLFSYDAADCNISTYPDAVAAKLAMK